MIQKSIITNGRFVTPSGVRNGELEIVDGKIASISKSIKVQKNDNVFDARNQYILPGLIETHGHFREPGLEHKEDIEHGTRAAIAGGFTTVFDMPNTKPPITTVALLKDQIARYKVKSYCDFAINFGSSVEHISELEIVDPKDITGVKVFTAGHQTTPTTIPKLSDQAKIWEIAARRGFPVLVHAENQDLVSSREAFYKSQGNSTMMDYSNARNELVVEMAAWEAVILAKYYKTKLWILHASTKGEFDAIQYARKNKVTASGEVTGYQLFFTTDDYKKYGTKIKVSPALRSPEVNRELWEMVRNCTVDGLCSEHTPHLLSEKDGDVWSAVSGTPGIQETVAAFITGWIRTFGKETLEEALMSLARMSCFNIAKFFGFEQKLGIMEGNDADLVMLNTNTDWIVKKEDLFTKLQWSAYEGMKLRGRPIATWLRGKLVYYNGKIVGNKNGKWLRKR